MWSSQSAFVMQTGVLVVASGDGDAPSEEATTETPSHATRTRVRSARRTRWNMKPPRRSTALSSALPNASAPPSRGALMLVAEEVICGVESAIKRCCPSSCGIACF
jgi:hypothetical protein